MIYNKTKTDRRFVFGKDRNIMERKEKSLLSRNKILEATGALFAEKGFDATAMQDIMARSGLSKGAIYHHFKSKEEIMQALGDKMFFDNNPFDEIRKRTELNGLQKSVSYSKMNFNAAVF